jgi:hypothetical protein
VRFQKLVFHAGLHAKAHSIERRHAVLPSGIYFNRATRAGLAILARNGALSVSDRMGERAMGGFLSVGTITAPDRHAADPKGCPEDQKPAK